MSCPKGGSHAWVVVSEGGGYVTHRCTKCGEENTRPLDPKRSKCGQTVMLDGSIPLCGGEERTSRDTVPPRRTLARRVLAGAGLVLAAAVAGVLSAVAGMFWAGGAW